MLMGLEWVGLTMAAALTVLLGVMVATRRSKRRW